MRSSGARPNRACYTMFVTLQGPFRQYVPNVLWLIINVFCLGLTFLQLRRLSLEVRRRGGGGEKKVRMYWIIAITHATFWSPLYLQTSAAWRSSQDRKSLTEEVTSVRPGLFREIIWSFYTAGQSSPGLPPLPDKPRPAPPARHKATKSNFINLWLPGRS